MKSFFCYILLAINNINKYISLKLINFVKIYHLEKLIWFFADFPIFFEPIFLVSVWIYFTVKKENRWKEKLLYIFYATVLAIITNLIIQQFVYEKRPETFIEPILEHVPDASFPSDHAAVSFAFLISLYLFGYKRVFWIFLPFVVLMNVSRIAGWLHWFWDVIVWMLVWWFSVFIIWKFKENKLFKKINWFILKVAKFFRL